MTSSNAASLLRSTAATLVVLATLIITYSCILPWFTDPPTGAGNMVRLGIPFRDITTTITLHGIDIFIDFSLPLRNSRVTFKDGIRRFAH
ncbi:MAG: hypothetical protein H7240_09250 [Glaciimonas sp.]|nr:hypothetical protein [Glaciimonas sp.]